MTTHLHFPLKDQLQDPLDQSRLDKSWLVIGAQLNRAESTLKKGRIGALLQWLSHELRRPATLLTMTAVLVLVVLTLSFNDARLKQHVNQDDAIAALRLQNGDLATNFFVDEGQSPEQIVFQDGSTIELTQGNLRALSSNRSEVTLQLPHGQARFAITPGGPRKWTIRTPLADIQVLGTIFEVASQSDGVQVRVERGLVGIRSRSNPNKYQELSAGSSLNWGSSANQAPLTTPLAVGKKRKEPPVVPSLSLDELEEDPEPFENEVDPSLEQQTDTLPLPSTQTELSAAELMAQADIARSSKNYTEASRVLGELLALFPNDPLAPSAAFTRGVIQVQQLGQSHNAIVSFQKVVHSNAPTSLQEDAYRRWFDTLLSLGHRQKARSLLAKYESAFPKGQYLKTLKRALAPTNKIESIVKH